MVDTSRNGHSDRLADELERWQREVIEPALERSPERAVCPDEGFAAND